MGMFDEVIVKCPKCGEMNTLQSKGGRCVLNTYSLDDCPEDVLKGLDESFYCSGCEKVLKLVPKVVTKTVVVVEEG